MTGWTLSEWIDAAASDAGALTRHLDRLDEASTMHDPAWIHRLDRDAVTAQLAGTNRGSNTPLPLRGVPFAVKDNIDAAGVPTTAGCPEFAYTPADSAPAVEQLRAAGAILLGKTNLDQFATGLVGTRSPYGVVPNSVNPIYIGGGSSSGSASVVARGLVPFALGTDTAGSGRVPAGFNNIVGLKPTRGSISSRGVVPACRSLDCVSIFALTVTDAVRVHGILAGYDDQDPFSRQAPIIAPRVAGPSPRLAVPAQLRWHGDVQAADSFSRALVAWEALRADIHELDFSPLHELAELLYEGPWIAERYAAVGAFLEANPEAAHPVVRDIILRGRELTAVDVFRAQYRLAELQRAGQALIRDFDALLVPTSPTIFRIDEVVADPVTLNSKLGTYTNFVNLLDCCALALPAGHRDDGLPFGVTLIGPAWHDGVLADLGHRWQAEQCWTLGATGRPMPTIADAPVLAAPAAGSIRLAVVGAHLRGMPLNHQLTDRGAVFVQATHTAPDYRLLALPGTTPPKPGLVRSSDGGAIEVELWDMPETAFGSFVAAIPSPLGIGTLTLADERQVKGFICEGWAADSARDITAFGGWRAFMASEGATAHG